MANLEVRPITLNELLPLRNRALYPKRVLEDCRYETDQKGLHFGLFLGSKLVSIASLFSEKNPLFPEASQIRLRSMGTEPTEQGKGYGGKLLLALKEKVLGDGVRLFWFNARIEAIAFYERHGFQIASEVFDIPNVGPHRVMYLRLQFLAEDERAHPSR